VTRTLRIDFNGAYHHIYFRGNRKYIIFQDDYDRKKFLELVKKSEKKYQNRVLAYCLMPNHVHLLVKSGKYHIGNFMRYLLTNYAQYYNKKYSTVGHLTQGRYKNVLIDKDSYYSTLINYIHFNPVRAGIVKTPDKYHWSSYNDYKKKYNSNLVLKNINRLKLTSKLPIMKKVSSNCFYGDKNFIENCLLKSKNDFREKKRKGSVNIKELEEYIMKKYKVNFSNLRKIRNYLILRVVIVILHDRVHLTFPEIGKIFRLNYRSISYHYNKEDCQFILDKFDKNWSFGV